jgi:hypothetical protein
MQRYRTYRTQHENAAHSIGRFTYKEPILIFAAISDILALPAVSRLGKMNQ